MKLWAVLPELILAGLCLALVPVAGWARGRWRVVPGIAAVAGLVACLALTARMLAWEPIAAFEGTYAVDGFAHVFKLLIESGALITILITSAYFRGHSQAAQTPVAILFATLGAVCLTSSLDLGLIILFLQMMSIAGYVLVTLAREQDRTLEAAIKYFIYGAVALAVMAYGLTFIYGLTGSLDLRVIGTALQGGDRLWIALALGLILVGYGFEITMVPFHLWAPDVFEGATAPIVGFISVVPKIAAFAGLQRFLLQGLPHELVYWPLIVAAAAALTMTFGNLVALRQTQLKRLLAYSSIAQAGYILIAVAVSERTGGALSAVGYYLAAYVFMNLGAFAVVAQLERSLGSDSFDAVRGLGRRAPFPALVLTLSLFSLAGIPPLAGFAGKVLLLKAVLEGRMTWLGIVAALNMAVALFYYVRVIAEMYLKPPAYDHPMPGGTGYTLTYGLSVLGSLALGIIPGPALTVTDMMMRLLK